MFVVFTHFHVAITLCSRLVTDYVASNTLEFHGSRDHFARVRALIDLALVAIINLRFFFIQCTFASRLHARARARARRGDINFAIQSRFYFARVRMRADKFADRRAIPGSAQFFMSYLRSHRTVTFLGHGSLVRFKFARMFRE